jgi:GINS complex subunit 4
MVTAPETKEVVIVRCLAEMVRIVVPADIPPAGTGSVTASGWARQEVLGHGAAMRKGEVWIVRWEGVRDAWENGDVEVL